MFITETVKTNSCAVSMVETGARSCLAASALPYTAPGARVARIRRAVRRFGRNFSLDSMAAQAPLSQ